MNSTAREIAQKLDGSVEGDGEVLVTTLAKIEDAPKGSLSFLAHEKYTPFLSNTDASVVLIKKGFDLTTPTKATLIRVANPYTAFTSLLVEVAKKKEKSFKGIHKTALVDPSATISDDVYIGPFVSIGANTVVHHGVQLHSYCSIGSDVEIGANSTIYERVSVLDECKIGARCIIHPGTVIGCDGFGFASQKEGTQMKIPQLGNVIVKDDVEIGANTTIDRATLGATLIHEGVKLDNLVQIAHNVEIGPHTVVAAQTGIAGSTKIGARCVIGGQVGIIGHLVLGDDIQIQGQTGVISNIPNGKIIQGTPATDFKSFYRSYAIFKRLPDLESRLSKIEKK